MDCCSRRARVTAVADKNSINSFLCTSEIFCKPPLRPRGPWAGAMPQQRWSSRKTTRIQGNVRKGYRGKKWEARGKYDKLGTGNFQRQRACPGFFLWHALCRVWLGHLARTRSSQVTFPWWLMSRRQGARRGDRR